MKMHPLASKLVLRGCLSLCAAVASTAAAPWARADVLAFDEQDGVHFGGTVGWVGPWSGNHSPTGELVQGAGYYFRMFNAPLASAGGAVWIAVTGRMDSVMSSYAYHVPVGAKQHPGLHFSLGRSQGLIDNEDTRASGVAATTKQTWLARYDFGDRCTDPDGGYDITVSAWTARGTGTDIDISAPPRYQYVIACDDLLGFYAGTGSEGPRLYVDRESVATSAEEALGLRRDLYVVAHQDDDLLFMSPDLAKSIQSGNAVRTVYVTDGAVQDPGYIGARENGVMAAYAAMANAPNVWSCAYPIVAGKTLKLCTLNDRVSLVFMRLPADYADPDTNWLKLLWSAPGYSVTSTIASDPQSPSQDPGMATYYKSDAIAVLTQLMEDFTPNHVGTLDSAGIHGHDHIEHHHSALFALEAHHAYVGEHVFRLYRGYNINDEPRNLADQESKSTVFQWYAACAGCSDQSQCGSAMCSDMLAPGDPFYEYCWREYPIAGLGPGSGPITLGGGTMCLTVSADGVATEIDPCAGSPEQRWALTADHHLVGLGGKCLTVGGAGSGLELADCAVAAEQRWTALDDGMILGQGGACLEVSGSSTVSVHTCTGTGEPCCLGTPNQLWNFAPTP